MSSVTAQACRGTWYEVTPSLRVITSAARNWSSVVGPVEKNSPPPSPPPSPVPQPTTGTGSHEKPGPRSGAGGRSKRWSTPFVFLGRARGLARGPVARARCTPFRHAAGAVGVPRSYAQGTKSARL